MEPISVFSQRRFFFETPLFLVNRELFQGGCNLWYMTLKSSLTSLLPSNNLYERIFFHGQATRFLKVFYLSITICRGRSVWPLRIPSRKTKLLSQYLAWKFTTKYIINNTFSLLSYIYCLVTNTKHYNAK